MLADGYVTRRGGHYVLPVLRQYQKQFDGAVIDTSATGATLFMEPRAIAALQEEMAQMEAAEDAETRRILYTLSSLVAEHVLRRNQLLNFGQYCLKGDFSAINCSLQALDFCFVCINMRKNVNRVLVIHAEMIVQRLDTIRLRELFNTSKALIRFCPPPCVLIDVVWQKRKCRWGQNMFLRVLIWKVNREAEDLLKLWRKFF